MSLCSSLVVCRVQVLDPYCVCASAMHMGCAGDTEVPKGCVHTLRSDFLNANSQAARKEHLRSAVEQHQQTACTVSRIWSGRKTKKIPRHACVSCTSTLLTFMYCINVCYNLLLTLLIGRKKKTQEI